MVQWYLQPKPGVFFMDPKYPDLAVFMKKTNHTQATLGKKVGRDQRTMSAYLRKAIPIPPDVEAKLRELDYDGPINTISPVLFGEIDLRSILAEAQKIVTEIEKREKRAMKPELRAELLTLVAEEIQVAQQRGRPASAQERIDRWWRLTGGTR